MTYFLRQMAEKADDGIMFVDAKGYIVYWNRGCEEIFGFEASEAVGKSLDIIIPVKHRERHWKGFYQVLRTGETAYKGKMLKVPAIKKDGSRLIIQFSIQLIEKDGEYTGYTSIVRDVTP